ncbi:MAG: hypothetical protein HPY66_0397 [Firmicutes bacterium]|nr:hypothetical protein [Bacillota bacterium]MDI6705096.1 YhdT family protein [Bacillota bacterium]
MTQKRTGKEFKEDKRYTQANKEALIAIGLFILNFIWWYGFAYGLGARPVEEYTYVMGLPAWFFYSCVAGFVVFSFASWFMVKFLFKDIPLDDNAEQ